MADRLTQCVWGLAENGYQWMKLKSIDDGKAHWYLTDGVPIGTRYRGSTYTPFQNTGLFLNFARLTPNKPEFRAFAIRYGLLTGGGLISIGNVGAWGETFEFWKFEREQLERAVSIWSMVKDRDRRGLAEYICWRGRDAVRYRSSRSATASGRWIATKTTNAERLDKFRVGDLVLPAWCYLQDTINERLAGCVAPRLLWDSNNAELNLYNTPKDLISAMWLQFARAVGGDRKYQYCEHCTDSFEVKSPGAGRSDKRFCGPACRARAYRNREQAKQAS